MGAFLPAMNTFLRRSTGPNGTPPNTIVWAGHAAALWFSRGRARDGTLQKVPAISYQVALVAADWFVPPGWVGNPPVWDYTVADQFFVQVRPYLALQMHPVFGGPMWIGTPEEHVRFECTPANFSTPTPVLAFPTGRSDGRTVSFDVFRPFGAANAVSTGNVGVLYSDLPTGRLTPGGVSSVQWTHFLDVTNTLDVRDGTSRAAGLDDMSYADGDEIRSPSVAPLTHYVVVQVQKLRDLNGNLFQRVYLFRDSTTWPLP